MESDTHSTIYIHNTILKRRNKTPYKEVQFQGENYMRSFSRELTEDELTWHQDSDSRVIKPTSGGGKWLLQFENKHPFRLEEYKDYYIPEGKWHRLINDGASSDLRILIKHNVSILKENKDIVEVISYPKVDLRNNLVPLKKKNSVVEYVLGKIKIKVLK